MRDYVTVPTALAASIAGHMATPVLNKQQRYDARLNLLSGARAKLADTTPPAINRSGVAAADATRVAPSAGLTRLAGERQRLQAATDRLACNNVAVERARLSEYVYSSDKVPPVPAPEGWHQLSVKELARKGITSAMLNDPKLGFKAALYQSAFERPPKLVVAYAGTENMPDWTTNLQQGIGVETKQYTSAMKLARKVVKSADVNNTDITGHSLGGGLASAATVVTGAKGYSFNAAGLHPNTVARAPYGISAAGMAAMGRRIDAYHSTADPLTNLQSGIALAQGPLHPYTVGHEALGQPHDLLPTARWQHEWKDLVRHNPLTITNDMALDGPGLDPQLVDHIETQKN